MISTPVIRFSSNIKAIVDASLWEIIRKKSALKTSSASEPSISINNQSNNQKVLKSGKSHQVTAW